VTPGDDTGVPDPRLVAGLDAGDDAAVRSTLLSVRLIVPLIATGEDSTSAEMSVPQLVGADGRRALPVFSSVDSLRAWRAQARPVPANGAEVVVSAVEDGIDALVIDVAGPVMHVIETADLDVLAAAARRLLAGKASSVHVIDR
jgi:hypothetical protein